MLFVGIRQSIREAYSYEGDKTCRDRCYKALKDIRLSMTDDATGVENIRSMSFWFPTILIILNPRTFQARCVCPQSIA